MKNIHDILKKANLNMGSYHTDIKFLRDHRTCCKMTLGKKDKQYTQRMEKRQRRLKHEQLAQRDEQFVERDYLTTEFEFFSDSSNVNTSISIIHYIL